MQATNKKKLFKILSPWLKLIVLVGTFWFIYQRLIETENLSGIIALIKSNFSSSQKLFLLIVVIMLMMVNWSLETIKWRYLILKIENLSFYNALKGVLSGVTVSLFMPNRIGEYAGRVVYIQKADRLQAALITVISSLAQLLITILVGALAFIVYLFLYQPDYFGKIEFYIAIQFYIVFASLLLLVFLNSSVFTLLLRRIKFLRIRYEKYISVFGFYTTKELAYALGVSFARYVIFSVQYYLVLQFFEVDLTLTEAVILIPVYFIALTAIPTISLAELGVREVVAISVFTLITTNEFGLVATSFVIWCINLALPALLGAVVVLKAKIFKSTKP